MPLPRRSSRLQFLSTLSLRRATRCPIHKVIFQGISIHALLAESDCEEVKPMTDNKNFYPRSPCGERQKGSGKSTTLTNFYPRSPCGERRFYLTLEGRKTQISIHALLAESDLYLGRQNPERGEFLSTLSLRRATERNPNKRGQIQISIHALLAESDWLQLFLYYQDNRFLSTLSLRRATRLWCFARFYCFDFYPRSPCGERPYLPVLFYKKCIISIHALLAESDGLSYVL